MNRISRSLAYLKGGPRPAAPQEIVIELTNRCELRCPICPRRSARRPVGDIPWEMFVNLVEQAERLGVRVVDLCLAGESLLYPRIWDAVREVKDRGMLAYLQTSGAPLDETMAEGLIGAGLDILSISLDATTPQTYSRVRPGADFGRVVANVEGFLARTKSERRAGHRAPYSIVQMILQAANEGEVEEFRRRWTGSGANAVRCKPMGTNRDLHGLRASSAHPPPGGTNPPPCTRPWRGMAVTWSGHALACCYDFDGAYPLGDVARKSLDAIWIGERLARLRQMHAEGRAEGLDLCRECSARRTGPGSRLAAAASLMLDEGQILKILPWLGRPV